MAATRNQQLSSTDRHLLQCALETLADEHDVLELDAIAAASGVNPDAIRGVMEEQAADPFIPVEPAGEDAWRVED